jgi:hypothetical protein
MVPKPASKVAAAVNVLSGEWASWPVTGEVCSHLMLADRNLSSSFRERKRPR